MTLKGLTRTAACFILISVFTTSHAWAQFTSAIEGTVTDASGAVIPGAAVTVTNSETKISREVVTSDVGYFRVSSLPAATFEVTATLPGFKTAVIKDIRLEVSQTRTLNITLQVGEAETKVTVTGTPAAVETSEARVSGFIQERQVKNLPLVGRNFYTLVVLTPGVTGLPSGGGQAYAQATADVFNAEFGVNLNANGQRAESNSFLVDSASVNASPRGGVANVTPNADSVQELRVSVNNFSAEYARNASAVVNVVTKTGTNDLHGTLGWFFTNNRLTSRNVFQRTVPNFRRNETTWSIGGPIRRNSTFFFGSMDILRSNVGVTNATSVVSPQFIDYMKANFPKNISTFIMSSFPGKFTPTAPGILAGPLAGTNCASLAGGPTSLVNTPIGQMPCNFPLTNNGIFSDTVLRNGLQYNVRVDHTFNNANDRLYGNFYRTKRDTVAFAAPNVYPDFTVIQPEYTMYFNLSFTHVFAPNLLNEMAVSATRARGDVPIKHGEIPNINVPGIASYGLGFSDATFIQNNLEWRDVLTYNRGAHSFKTGFKYAIESGFRGAGAFFQNVNTRPSYNFLNLFDFARDDPFSQNGLGINPKTGGRAGFPFRPIFPAFGTFFQDDWKVRRNLTLSLGVRWETFLVPDDHDKIFNAIVFQGGNNFFERITNAKMERKRPMDRTDWNNIAPRFGLAWDPTGRGKVSVRAGAGIFHDRPGGQFFHDAQTYLPVFAVVSVSKQTAVKPVYGLSKTTSTPWDFPYPALQIGLDAKNGLLGAPSFVEVNDPRLETQYSANWFLGVQFSLNPIWSVEADYIGSGGRKLYQVYDVNRFNGDLFDGKLDRLNTSFGGINYGAADGSSAYHGGTFSLRKRESHGLDIQVAYTLGRAIDTASSFGRGLAMVDVTNMRLNRGLSNFDIRQKLAASYLYQLPVANRSRAAGKLLNGWQVSGIAILQAGSPYSVFCTQPFIPVRDSSGKIIGNNGCDFNADGFNYDFLNTPSFGNSKHGDRRDFQFPNKIFAASDFPKPGIGQDGTLGRNTFIGPGYISADLNLTKNTTIPWFGTETANVQFRAEFFNLFNRVNLQNPVGSITSSVFGSSTSAFPARNIQFGLRLEF